jgi:hydrogenase maturation protein HypF
MLATSPIHAMLLDLTGKPLVVTSGNVHGSPLVYQNEMSETQLAGIADVFLHHDREIKNPVDDSVLQCFGEQFTTIRAARGIAPLTKEKGLLEKLSDPDSRNGPSGASHHRVQTPFSTSIALGGHQKVAIAIRTGSDFVLSPHIGDMESESCRIRFQESVVHLQSLYQTRSHQLVCDQHSNYFTSSWARDHGLSPMEVQHHYAHVAAAMLDHGLLDKTVLGVAFDGTGFSHDGTIWGGEVLLATRSSYERVGHLRCFRLPGGENAIKHPRRIAASLLAQLDNRVIEDSVLRYAIEHGPNTSSMGRLFDGVAAMLLDIETIDYEGEAAMRLEAHCDWNEGSAYEFAIDEFSPIQFDWRPVVVAICADMPCVSTERIAMKFHRSVANLVIALANRYESHPCVVTGGVFQNRVLLELINEMAARDSLDIRLPGKIPVNDGGLALGQLVVASTPQSNRLGDKICV